MNITPFDDAVSIARLTSRTILILVGYGIETAEQFLPAWVPVEEIVLWQFPWLWLL